MKKLKYIIFFTFLSLFCPSCIQALTKEEAVKLVNQYIEKAIKSDWNVSFSNSSYSFSVDVANLDDIVQDNETFRDLLKNIEKHNSKLYDIDISIYACLNENSCDKYMNHQAEIGFGVYLDENDTKIYLVSYGEITSDDYKIFKNAKKILYTISTNQTWNINNIELESFFTGGAHLNEGTLVKKEGSMTNPYVITDKGSVTLPSKDDSYWNDSDNKKCIYFTFHFDSPTGYARYFISPSDIVNFKIYEATHLNNLRGDVWNDDLYQVSNQLLYAFCDNYGTTVNFTFKDTEKINVLVDDGSGGDVNIIDSNNPSEEQTPNENEGAKEPDYKVDDSVNVNNICSMPEFRKPARLVGVVITFLKIIIPILIILFGAIDFYKAVTSQKDDGFKKATKAVAIRAVAGIAVFLLPGIVQMVLNMVNEWSGYKNNWCCCTECILNSNCDVNSCSSESCHIEGTN